MAHVSHERVRSARVAQSGKRRWAKPIAFVASLALAAAFFACLATGAFAADDPTATKTAVWKDASAGTATITITNDKEYEGKGSVLFLGTLCTAHELTDSTVANAVEALAKKADVEYHFFGPTIYRKVADTYAAEVSGTIYAGDWSKSGANSSTYQTKSAFQTYIKSQMASGHHTAIYEFARVLAQAKAAGKQYDLIVMEFDGTRLGHFVDNPPSAQEITNLQNAASYLIDYYRNNQVAWIVPSASSTEGADGHAGTYMFNDFYIDKDPVKKDDKDTWCLTDWRDNNRAVLYLLEPDYADYAGQTGYPAIEFKTVKVGDASTGWSKQNSDATPTTSNNGATIPDVLINDGGTYRRASLSEQKLLIDRATETDADKKIYVYYDKSSDVDAFLEKRLSAYFDTVTLTDTMAAGYCNIQVTGEYYDATSKTWKDAGDKFSYTPTDATTLANASGAAITITGIFQTSLLRTNKVRMNITGTLTADGKKTYAAAKSTGVNTNEGQAKVTRTKDTENDEESLNSPKLVNYPVQVVYKYVNVDGDVPASAVGKEPTDSSSPYTITADNEASFTITPLADTTATAVTGYTFRGWYTDTACTTKAGATVPLSAFDATTSTLTLYGTYKEASAKLTYHANTGSATEDAKITVPTQQSITYKDATVVYAGTDIPVREGYAFKGWMNSATVTTADFDPGDTYKAANAYNGTGNTIVDGDLYALWSDTFTVTTSVENGTITTSQTDIEKGSSKTIEYAPITGYRLKSVTVDGSPVDIATYPSSYTFSNISANHTIKVVYEPITLTANAQGGTIPTTEGWTAGTTSETASTTRLIQQEYGTLPTPSRTGYSFNGWYSDPDPTKGTKVDSTTKMGDKDTTIYADWTEQWANLIYDANAGTDVVTGMPTTNPVKMTYTDATSIDAATPTRTGYVFKGWSEATTGTATHQPSAAYKAAKVAPNTLTGFVQDATDPAGGSVTLYALWAKVHTISYNSNGGSAIDPASKASSTIEDGQTAQGTQPNDPTLEGYTFGGWYTSEDGGATLSKDPYDFTHVWVTDDPDVTLYAKWNEITATLTYDANAGTDKVTNLPNPQTLYYEAAASISNKVPERYGYDFEGWSTESAGTKEYDPSDSYKEAHTTEMLADETLYALWSEHTATLIYDVNGGDKSTQPENANLKTTTATSITTDTPTREGYDFLGWAATKKDADKGTVDYDAADSYKAAGVDPEKLDYFDKDTKTVTLYAVWQEHSAKLTYDENAGSDVVTDMPSGSEDPLSLTYSNKAQLSAAVPQREGYLFKGWGKTQESATAGTVDYQASALYKNANVDPLKSPYKEYLDDTNTITLYAVWALVHKVTFIAGNDPAVNPDIVIVEDGTPVAKPQNPSRSGYTFEGWYTSEDGGKTLSDEPYDFSTPVTEDITLYGKWRADVPKTGDALATLFARLFSR